MQMPDPDAIAASLIPQDADLSPLTHETELALARRIDEFGELVAVARVTSLRSDSRTTPRAWPGSFTSSIPNATSSAMTSGSRPHASTYATRRDVS